MTDMPAKDGAHVTANTTEADDGSGRPPVRAALDAGDDSRLRRDPTDEDAKLDVAIDETFPASDAPSNTQPGKGKDPAPSSGYDPEAEQKLAEQQH